MRKEFLNWVTFFLSHLHFGFFSLQEKSEFTLKFQATLKTGQNYILIFVVNIKWNFKSIFEKNIFRMKSSNNFPSSQSWHLIYFITKDSTFSNVAQQAVVKIWIWKFCFKKFHFSFVSARKVQIVIKTFYHCWILHAVLLPSTNREFCESSEL